MLCAVDLGIADHRKSAGHQRRGFAWNLRALHQRSGSTQEFKYFARDVRAIVAKGDLLDYELRLESRTTGEFLHAKKRNATGRAPSIVARPDASVSFLRVSEKTFDQARRLAPGWDVKWLHEQWLQTSTEPGKHIRQPDRAFLAYCRKVAENSPARRAS